MCRSIKVLRGFETSATEQEVAEAALQYVRKVSGYRVPASKNTEAFDAAVRAVTSATRELLVQLPALKSSPTPKRTNHRPVE